MSGFEFLPQVNVTSIFTAGTFAAAVVALIRAWPILALQAQKAKEKLRAEGRSDLSDCQHRLDAMGDRMDELYERVNNLKIELAGVLSAYRVLEVAEEMRDPASLPLAQARAILSAVFTVAPSTSGAVHKTPTRVAAEDACEATEATLAQVKLDEVRFPPHPKDGGK